MQHVDPLLIFTYPFARNIKPLLTLWGSFMEMYVYFLKPAKPFTLYWPSQNMSASY